MVVAGLAPAMQKSYHTPYHPRLFISSRTSGCRTRESIAPQLSQAVGAVTVCIAPHVSHTQRRIIAGAVSKRIASRTAAPLVGSANVWVVILCAIMGCLLYCVLYIRNAFCHRLFSR